MGVPYDKPLSPAKATEHIRRKVGDELDLRWTKHAREQMAKRDIIMGDILHVLKNGFIYEEGQPASQQGCFKYGMECTTPNSGGRTLRVIVIPSTANALKVVTVMWKDEGTQSG